MTGFSSIEQLLATPPRPGKRRALVVLDDYIGTGSQFLFHFLARQPVHLELFQRYARVRLAAVVVQKEGSGTTEFLLGHHSFFYGAPNAIARVLLPLFKRIEDFTAYDPDILIGLLARIIDYNIENSDPITYIN